MTASIVFHMPDFLATASHDAKLLYCDFLRETALAFNAKLFVVGAVDADRALFRGPPHVTFIDDTLALSGTRVILTTNESAPFLQTFTWPAHPIIIVGQDDGKLGEIAGLKINIPLPTTYPLWGAVAAGVALHSYFFKPMA